MLSGIPSTAELEGGCDVLLSRPGTLVAGDVATAQQYLARVTEGRARLHTSPSRSGAVSFQALDMPFGAIHFQAMTSSCQGECQQSTERAPDDRVVMHIPLRGRIECNQAGRSVAVEPGALLVVGAPGKIWKTWSGERTWLAVTVQRPALRRALAAAFNLDFDEDPEFGSLEVVPLDRVPALFSLIKTVVLDLGGAAPAFRLPALARSMENTFLLTMLRSLSASHSDILLENASSCVPYYVRRAEKYIRENIRDDITIGDLAHAAGVSERTVYYGFRNFLGKSPMKYTSLLRLNLAREALIRGRTDGCNITQLAVSMGYATSSHFSRDYRKRFGESPSDTLRRN